MMEFHFLALHKNKVIVAFGVDFFVFLQKIAVKYFILNKG